MSGTADNTTDYDEDGDMTRWLTAKGLLALLGLLMVAAVAAACGEDESTPTTAPATFSAPPDRCRR